MTQIKINTENFLCLKYKPELQSLTVWFKKAIETNYFAPEFISYSENNNYDDEEEYSYIYNRLSMLDTDTFLSSNELYNHQVREVKLVDWFCFARDTGHFKPKFLDKYRNTSIHPLQFGNMLWQPNLVLRLPISRGYGIKKVLSDVIT